MIDLRNAVPARVLIHVISVRILEQQRVQALEVPKAHGLLERYWHSRDWAHLWISVTCRLQVIDCCGILLSLVRTS